jgi:hypothetical protein
MEWLGLAMWIMVAAIALPLGRHALTLFGLAAVFALLTRSTWEWSAERQAPLQP